jgi:hypothetical protein
VLPVPSRLRYPVMALLFLLLIMAQAAMAVSTFAPQRRLGQAEGDQWEPAMAADAHGHVYVLYPQYGPSAGCPACTAPTITLLISSDNGATWESPRALLPFPTGQFDPQIVVDPVDHQTLYASWLQNNRHDTIVARSLDFGLTWSFSVADRSPDDVDKPVLAVRGTDVYIGFNHEQKFFVAASHDAGQTFSSVNINPNAAPGWSLAGGATVDPTGNVYFGWTSYVRRGLQNHPVDVFMSRSSDGGRTWSTTLLDISSAPPNCNEDACGTAFLGAQVALASDSAGTVYALWNAGWAHGGPERIYFSSSTTAGSTWSAKVDVSTNAGSVDSGFPAIVAGLPGDVRVAWMDEKRTADSRELTLWNTYYRSSTNGGATWTPEIRVSTPVRGYDYILPAGFRFPFGDYFSLAIDNQGTTHAVWGEGANYRSPGSIWYTNGR